MQWACKCLCITLNYALRATGSNSTVSCKKTGNRTSLQKKKKKSICRKRKETLRQSFRTWTAAIKSLGWNTVKWSKSRSPAFVLRVTATFYVPSNPMKRHPVDTGNGGSGEFQCQISLPVEYAALPLVMWLQAQILNLICQLRRDKCQWTVPTLWLGPRELNHCPLATVRWLSWASQSAVPEPRPDSKSSATLTTQINWEICTAVEGCDCGHHDVIRLISLREKKMIDILMTWWVSVSKLRHKPWDVFSQWPL